jgi:hypothetical protein
MNESDQNLKTIRTIIIIIFSPPIDNLSMIALGIIFTYIGDFEIQHTSAEQSISMDAGEEQEFWFEFTTMLI